VCALIATTPTANATQAAQDSPQKDSPRRDSPRRELRPGV
jgi:hypothetical protein